MRKQRKNRELTEILQEFLPELKTRINDLAGKNRAVNRLNAYLKQPCSCHICDMAYILNHPLLATSVQWREMRDLFNAQWEREIALHYNLEVKRERNVTVSEEVVSELAYKFRELKNDGSLGKATFQDIANALFQGFHFPVELSTFHVYMKRGVSKQKKNPRKK